MGKVAGVFCSMVMVWTMMLPVAAQPPQEKKAGMAAKVPVAKAKAPSPALPFGGKEIEDSHFGFDGLNTYENEVIVPNIASIGAHWGRHPRSNPLWLRTVNEEGVPDYTECDRALEHAYEQGVMFPGDFHVFSPRRGPREPEPQLKKEVDLDKFAEYVRLTVERYDGDSDFGAAENSPLYPKCDANGDGRITEDEKKEWARRHRILYWQIENEPDMSSKNIPPRSLLDAMRVLYEATKSVSPQAKIVFPGFMDGAREDVLAKFEDLLRMGVGEYFDIMDQHVYPSYVPYAIDLNNKILAKYGYSGHWAKPWWITETGASDIVNPLGGGTPAKQAQQVVKRYCLGFAKGAEKILWYLARDPEAGRTDVNLAVFGGNGLLDADGNEKLGAKAYRLLTEKIDYFSSVEVLSMEEDKQVAVQPGRGVTMLRFSFSFKNPVYVAWSDDGRDYSLAVPKRWEIVPGSGEGMVELRPEQVKITDMVGAERTEEIRGETLNLKLTETPIYLEFSYSQSRTFM